MLAALALNGVALATEEVDDVVDSGGGGGEIVLLVGFILVGIIGAVIAARLARRSRDDGWQEVEGDPA